MHLCPPCYTVCRPRPCWAQKELATPDHRETTINVLHDSKTCHVWTNNRRVKTRLKSLGFSPCRKQIGGEWYEIPERAIWFKNPARRRLSEAQRRVLTNARKAVVRDEA